ncbi:MAG TPA: Fur family transcriptional regulator [Kofleriaceae bacterium]|nr:Fur family transcriptional regulator [Kofleriaceae bacterium]
MASRPNLDELRSAVRGKGLRATPSRLAVLELLRASDSPMSHGDVADRLASQAWDRATIYRNLTDLAEAGLVRRTDVGDHVWRFEAVSGEHEAGSHPHFVCTECGTVECLPELELAVRRAPQSRGKPPRAVKQRQVEVHVRGLCDACQ